MKTILSTLGIAAVTFCLFFAWTVLHPAAAIIMALFIVFLVVAMIDCKKRVAREEAENKARYAAFIASRKSSK